MPDPADIPVNEEQVRAADVVGWPDVLAPATNAAATSESVRVIARAAAQRTTAIIREVGGTSVRLWTYVVTGGANT